MRDPPELPKPRAPKWLSIPFGGASGREDEQEKIGHRGRRPHTRPSGGDGGIHAIPKRERLQDFANKSEEDAVEDFNAPMRWWVVSTLFPLIAGTFGPIASAFNICAVAIDWRIIVSSTSEEAEGSHIQDPQWLVAINAVSLAIAIVANVFLLAQMTGRLRFAIASPVTIIGWYISGLIDIVLVAIARSKLPLPTTDDVHATYSQAYYYACLAGGLYVLLSLMLSVNAAGIIIFRLSAEFKLSRSQRSIMLQTTMLVTYYLCAAAVYQQIEGWNYLDAFYWVNVTLFTIGFGDFSPKTHLGRSLLFPMAVGGILFVGLIIGSVRELVLESGSRKITTRVVEKTRFKALTHGDPANGTIKIRGKKPRQVEATTELERRAQEFQHMREILAAAAHDNRIITLLASAMVFFLLWLVGAVVFWQAESAVGGENWTYFESLYFTYVAVLTIGYGDYYPQTNSGKPAFVFWSLIALPTLTVLIGSIGDAASATVEKLTDWSGKHASRFWSSVNKALKAREKAHKESALDLAALHEQEPSFSDLAKRQAGRAIDRMATRGGPEMVENTQVLKDRVAAEEAGYAYRPYMIIKEIKKIVGHLDDDPGRQYSYTEWTKFLELLDEDEGNPDGHRIPGHPDHSGLEAAPPPVRGKRQAWSWMGQESPLMSTKQEPKWVLSRLIGVLEEDLKERGDKHVWTHLTKDEPGHDER